MHSTRIFLKKSFQTQAAVLAALCVVVAGLVVAAPQTAIAQDSTTTRTSSETAKTDVKKETTMPKATTTKAAVAEASEMEGDESDLDDESETEEMDETEEDETEEVDETDEVESEQLEQEELDSTSSETTSTELPPAKQTKDEEEEEEDTKETKVSEDETPRSTDNEAQEKRRTLGWVERIRLEPEGALLDAKLTPGSEGNVLHAEKIKTFKQDGTTWVSFETQDRKGDILTLKREVVDETRFRTTDGSLSKRYVIKVPICISRTYIELDFSLSNRNKFEQEVRIGRSALAGQFIIDPAKTKTTKPKCALPTKE